MKLCIPVKLPEGLESHLEPHLPHAAYLAFFDTESRSLDSVSLREPQPGDERHMNFDAVLCGSISRVVLRTLAMQGVKVYGTAAQTVVQAITQFENGELVAAETDAGSGCGGGGCGGGGCGGGGCQSEHGHEGDHEHAHDHDHAGHGCGGGGCGGHAHKSHEHGHGGCCGGHGEIAEAGALKPLGEAFAIAVCSQNRKTVTEHAGKCRKFWVYQIEQGEVTSKTLLELPLEQSFHAASPDEPHPLDKVDVVIGATMGDGLKQRLAARGITGVVTDIESPDEAVAVFVARVLGARQAETI
jgi:predicted Fe-Mo cluster-binding NifX family protein